MVCCMRDSIYVFDLRDGALLSILDGSSTKLDFSFEQQRRQQQQKLRQKQRKQQEIGGNSNSSSSSGGSVMDIPGHFGVITALAYSEHSIVSGGVDKLVRVWRDGQGG